MRHQAIVIGRVASIVLPLLASLLPAQAVAQQAQYPDMLLTFKNLFGERQNAALAEPFVGVHASTGVEPGLFPLQSTGVSVQPIVDAANALLTTLTPSQLLKTQFAVNDAEWRSWSNVDNGLYVRQGTSLEEMTTVQKQAAWQLLQVSLSARGLQTSRDIMKTDQTLRELNADSFIYGEEKYFFTLMGTPSSTEPWGWQLDGHHLILNYFVQGDQVVATPMFMGGEPIVTTTGKYAGNAILQDEQNQGIAFFQSLDDAQRSAALLDPNKRRNSIKAEAFEDNLELDYQGVPASMLTMAQRESLLALVELYVGKVRDDQAAVKIEEVTAHLDNTWFAWIGGFGNEDVFYYRIHSPVLLIEFDHQSPVGNPTLPPGIPTRQHIHTVVRTPNGNDYGKDLLRQHLESHPHAAPSL